jgi:hypothetical protein
LSPALIAKTAIKGNKPIHRFRFDGWIHGSWITPFAFVGTVLFDSSASEEHLYFRGRSMSHAEYASKSLVVLIKLAAMLRIVRAVQFKFDKLVALLRGKGNDEMRANEFLGEAFCITRSAVDQHATQSSSDHAIAETNDQPDREKLIRRRWLETGIKMWNPDHHGAGHAALNIQGQAELLPPKPGETLPGYDTLEFKKLFCPTLTGRR